MDNINIKTQANVDKFLAEKIKHICEEFIKLDVQDYRAGGLRLFEDELALLTDELLTKNYTLDGEDFARMQAKLDKIRS